jgi:hypothetical protein
MDGGFDGLMSLPSPILFLDMQLAGLDGFEITGWFAVAGDGPAAVVLEGRDASCCRARLAERSAGRLIPKWELSARMVASLVG